MKCNMGMLGRHGDAEGSCGLREADVLEATGGTANVPELATAVAAVYRQGL
jgi:hypothetical protein